MSVRYLLPCSCGKTVSVSPSQAGGTAACDCGARLEVPRLGEMRQLPTDESVAATAAGWGFRQGVLTAGLMLAAALAAGAGWFAAVEPEPPAPPDAVARQAAVERQVDAMSPRDLHRLLIQVYEPLAKRGFKEAKSPADVATLQRIDECRLYRNVLLGAAGAVVVVSLVLLAAART